MKRDTGIKKAPQKALWHVFSASGATVATLYEFCPMGAEKETPGILFSLATREGCRAHGNPLCLV